MSEPLRTTDPGPRRFAVGLVVGSASVLFGAVLLILWIQQRVAPNLLRLPPAPFFDNFVLWDRFSALAVAQVVAAICLVGVGAAILGRRRLAPPLFALFGWGGLAFTIVAAWPGDTVRFKLRTALNAAQRYGVVGADATVWQIIPAKVYVIGGVFLVLWLGLLIAGTVHLLRARNSYIR